MAGEQVEIVVRAVEIRRHDRHEIATMLAAISLAQLEPGDFGNGIPLVGWLERASQQAAFRHRLRREARINAGGAEKQQFCDAGASRRFDHVYRDCQIVVEEIAGMGVVGMNAAHPRRGEQHRLRAMLVEPAVDCRLVAEIDCIAADSQNLAFLLPQSADQRRTDHAAMAGDEYAARAKAKERRRRHVSSPFPPPRRLGRCRQTQPGSRSVRGARVRYRARPSS